MVDPAVVTVVLSRGLGRRGGHLPDRRRWDYLPPLPAALVQHQHADLGHVDGAQTQAPAARDGAGLVGARPAVVPHAERFEEMLCGILVLALAGRGRNSHADKHRVGVGVLELRGGGIAPPC